MKICTVIGARPQFIKAASVSRKIGERFDIHEVLIHTGQHYDANMSEVFFEELSISHPKYNLGVGGGTHGQNTGRMIEKIEEVLLKELPDKVMVYGDTDSTLAGALSAVKLHIPVVHVEAGLRSFNRVMPEEINRILTDHAADLLLTPTDTATSNLANEGVYGSRVHQVGDVMYDSALFYGAKAELSSKILEVLGLTPKSYVLATIHRSENTDDKKRMRNIFDGFAESQLPIIMPLHPRTLNSIRRMELQLPQAVRIIDPVGYLDMIMLEKHANMIATDSGGVQKEAYFHCVPCLTLRDETEWVELVQCGFNKLVGTDAIQIANALNQVFSIKFDNGLYGHGDSALRIVDLLSST